MVLATAKATNTSDPYLSVGQQHWGGDPDAETKLMFTVLTADKDSGSKVKFSDIYVIISPHPKDNAIEIYKKVKTAVLEAIWGTKAGEGGFSRNPNGSCFNACDSIPDCVKFITEAINASEVNDEEHKRATVGINCNSSEYFQAEAQQYDIDGPKNLMDGPGMADWYAKLCKENPLITYLEDPF